MTTAINVKTIFLGTVLLFLAMFLGQSCADNKNGTTKTPPLAPVEETITINGTVRSVTFGKDGYTADVQTEKEGTYACLVSIVNVGGPDKYKSCEEGENVTFKGILSNIEGKRNIKVTEIINITPVQTQMLISPTSFRGITVGDAITKHKEYTQKTKLKTGEGTFEVYEIKDFDNNPAGYFLPDPNNKLLVGDITVTTPKAQTAKGIKVGSTYQDLEKALPGIEVHGSEIEGRTNATANNLSYRLDAANFTYQIDASKIPATTKIIEITINRPKTK